MNNGIFRDGFNRVQDSPSLESTAKLGKHWGWLFVSGIVYAILGIYAIVMPISSSIGLTYAVAFILLISGVMQLVRAIRLHGHHGEVMRYLQAVLALAAGGLILRYPEGGLMTLALMLSFYFFIGAAMQWMFALSLHPLSARLWIYFSAIVSFIIGVYIIASFPFSALWVPGTLLGIELIVIGVGTVGFSISARRLYRETPEGKSHTNTKGMGFRPSGQAT